MQLRVTLNWPVLAALLPLWSNAALTISAEEEVASCFSTPPPKRPRGNPTVPLVYPTFHLPGRKQDAAALVFAEITAGHPPPPPPPPPSPPPPRLPSPSARDDSAIHNGPPVARSALMALNNILDYLEGGRGSAPWSQLREQDQKAAVYLRKQKCLCFICISRFYSLPPGNDWMCTN